MELKYLLLSDDAARTIQGKTILHGIFDTIGVVGDFNEKDGLVHPKMVIAYEITGVDLKEKHAVKTEMKHIESGEVCFSHSFESGVEDRGEGDRIGTLIQIAPLHLKKLGGYSVELQVDGRVIGSTRLDVNQMAIKK